MPFFLLSRDDNDGLRLLTTKTWPSRQAALAELSRLTADPAFDAWDTDVVLVDLDSATPVLMVRPAGNAAAESAPVALEEPELAPEPHTDAAMAEDVYVAEADMPASVVVEPLGVIPAEEAEAFAAYVSPADEAETTETAVEEPLPVPEMASDFATEPELEDVLSDFEPAAGFVSVDEDADDLREALERTTAAMEEEALSEEPTEPVEAAALPATETWPWDAVAQAEPVEAAVDISPSVEAEAPVSEAAADVAAVSAFLEDLEPILPSLEPSSAPVAAEPVAASAAPEVEPEPEPEPEAVAEAVAEVVPELAPEVAAEVVPEPEPELEPAADVLPELAPLAAPSAAASTVDEYVCADCVYYETCPNKDERLPKNCGSFQWK